MNDIFQGFDIDTTATPPVLSTMEIGEPINTLSLAEEKRAEWFQQRWGKFTASEFHKLMTYEDKDELPKGGQSHAKKKAAELITRCVPDTYVSPAMQWGIDHEHEALDAFMSATGIDVEDGKDTQQFITLGDDIGGTPDGRIPALDSGIEIKCPNSDTHLDYLSVKTAADLKALAPEYYWQIMGLMLITGASSWFFVSYDPRFLDESMRLHITQIDRDEIAIAKLQRRLELAIEHRDAIITGIKGTVHDSARQITRKALSAYAKEQATVRNLVNELLERIGKLEAHA